MKNTKSSYLFIIPFLLSASILNSAVAYEISNGSKTVPVIIVPEDSGEIRPRNVVEAPIYCYYDTSAESVGFVFYEDIGAVTISVRNNTTGEEFFASFPSGQQNGAIQLSGTNGEYRIHITTSLGKSYSGAFTI
ncbi:MAG TPA: hypothetical protein P5123_12035 [Spirochaetota bacterium]|nr:hypothetical protein [Spirochaetota bacterium]